MFPKSHFIRGVFTFEGVGLDAPISLGPSATYVVPSDRRAQLTYMRGGNTSDELVVVRLDCDGQVMRYFPIGAKASLHVSLAIVEDILPESKLEMFIVAPEGCSGSVVVDFGLILVG